MVMDPTLPRISVRDLMMQAFLTGWELSDKTVSQDEYLQSSIQVIEMLQVEPENLYAEEGLGLQYLVDFSLKRENPSSAENFGNSNPVQLRS